MAERANAQQAEKEIVGQRAAELVESGMTLGLGTGSTVRCFAAALGRRVRQGLRVSVIPTSRHSRALAEENGIPLADWDRVETLDLSVDGADEVSADFAMIKGGGGALLHEKIVAAASRRRVYIADSTKLVQRLGRFPLPVEICRFGHQTVIRRLAGMAREARLRLAGDGPFVSDAGNYIVDCSFEVIADAAALHRRLTDIPGVLETGLFLGMIDRLITCRDGAAVSVGPADGAFWARGEKRTRKR